MASMRDKKGRPIVVVTGVGVVTSLGIGKKDNWAKLTAGESGIRQITRFSTEKLKTRIAGTVDFLPVEPMSRAGALRAARRNRRRGGDRAGRHRPQGRFSRVRCSSRSRRSRSNGRSAARSPRRAAPMTPSPMTSCCATAPQFDDFYERFLFGSVADKLAETLRHQGLADLAVDRLRVGRDRDPARRRGDPARRDRRRALHRHRRLGQRRNR